MSVTFITTERGEKVFAVVPIRKYKKLLNKVAELEDIATYDKAVKRNMKFVELETALEEIEKSRKAKVRRTTK